MKLLKNTKSWAGRLWKEWRSTVLVFTFVVIPAKSSQADLNWVPTGSMNPTIVEGDLVHINKMAYDLRAPLTLKSIVHISDPQPGDIAVLFSPKDETRLVKRVIGVPGDTLEMFNNQLIINGTPIRYEALNHAETADLQENLRSNSIFASEKLTSKGHAVMSTPAIMSESRSFAPISIPSGYYFVMGDNRDNSMDSRSFGLVERKLFVGKAKNVVASFNILDWYQPRFNRFFTALK